jgi:hypothetical protein
LQVRPEPPGVNSGSASLTPQAEAQPSVLPRGLPRFAEVEAHRQKTTRGHGSGDGKLFGIIPEQVSLSLVSDPAFTPIHRSRVLWSALVRAFEPRGPPRTMG